MGHFFLEKTMSELRKTELFSFAFFPDFNLAISELAELAEPEAWDFSDEPPELRSNNLNFSWDLISSPNLFSNFLIFLIKILAILIFFCYNWV